MAYRRRSTRRYARKSRTNFIATILIIAVLIFATFQWFLPGLINVLGFVTSILKPSHKSEIPKLDNASLAPPVLNISYEATNTAKINISGFGTPNSKVAIYLDDEKKDTVDVSDDGSFIFRNIALVLGTNNIFGKSIDPDKIGVDDKNQESLPSKTFKIIYDNEKPSLNLNEPEDGRIIHGGDRKVKFVGKTEAGARMYINDSQVIVDKEGKFSSEQTLNDGENNFNIKAVDTATNTTEISRKVTYNP